MFIFVFPETSMSRYLLVFLFNVFLKKKKKVAFALLI